MDEVTQQNAALVEEAAAAAESMEEQAGNLAAAVAVFRLQSGSSALGDEFDFAKAVQAHLDWKRKLHDAIDGKGEKLDAAVVSLDDRCALGQWIYGPGRRFAKYTEHASLRAAHAGFHECAGAIAEMAQHGKHDEAQRTLDGDFKEASKKTISQITALRKMLEELAKRGSAKSAMAAKPAALPAPGKKHASVHRHSAANKSRDVKSAKASADGEWAEF